MFDHIDHLEKDHVQRRQRVSGSVAAVSWFRTILPDPLQESPVNKRRRRRTITDREKTRQQLQYGHSHVTNTHCYTETHMGMVYYSKAILNQDRLYTLSYEGFEGRTASETVALVSSYSIALEHVFMVVPVCNLWFDHGK